jgi:hypothetical protein
VDIVRVEYVKFDDLWRADAAQTSPHSVPSINSESPLYFASQETAGFIGQPARR